MTRCIARRKDLERCTNDAERGSIFCRRHRWWWLVTLFGAIVVLTTVGSNVATMFGVTFENPFRPTSETLTPTFPPAPTPTLTPAETPSVTEVIVTQTSG